MSTGQLPLAMVPFALRAGLLAVSLIGFTGCGGDRVSNNPGMTTNKDMGTTGTGCSNCGSSICCNNKCTNAMTDAHNCGGCGKACPAGEVCVGGVCECSGPNGQGAQPCSGAGKACCNGACIDLNSDNTNCGSCANNCDPNGTGGETCQMGQCGCGNGGSHCPGGQSCCSSMCVDVTTDPANCGACANTCAQGDTCAAGTCSGGGGQMCGGVTCAQGEMCVANMCIGGGGGCMPACANGQMCLLGMCIGGGGGGCGNGCAMGQMCIGGLVCSCASDKDCNGKMCIMILGTGVCSP